MNESRELWGLLGYFCLAALFCLCVTKRKPTENGLWRRVITFTVPASIYRKFSVRYDLAVFLGNRAVCIWLAILFGVHVAASPRVIAESLLTAVSSGDFFHPQYIALNLAWTFWSLFAFDFSRTIVHYAFHKIPMLWEFHKLHHDAPALTPLTKYRVQVVEYAFTSGLNVMAVAFSYEAFVRLFGKDHLNVLTVFGWNMLAFSHLAYGHFLHSHMRLSFGRWGKILTSPSAHQIHHSVEQRHRHKNFSLFFPFFDLVLGTLYSAEKEEHFKIGLRKSNGAAYENRSLSYFYFGVYADSIRSVLRRPTIPDSSADPVDQDGLHCWCGPGCPEINYPFDRPDEVAPTGPRILAMHFPRDASSNSNGSRPSGIQAALKAGTP